MTLQAYSNFANREERSEASKERQNALARDAPASEKAAPTATPRDFRQAAPLPSALHPASTVFVMPRLQKTGAHR